MAFCIDARDNQVVRRWTIRILICLLLGAITTVAVSWGCAVWAPNRLGSTGILSISDTPTRKRSVRDHWAAPVPTDWASHSVHWWLFEDAWQTHVLALDLPNHQNEPIKHQEVSLFGVPARSFYWSSIRLRSFRSAAEDLKVIEFSNSGLKEGLLLSQLPLLDRNADSFRRIPLHPIWPGLLFDTLFYAAIWFGVFIGFTGARRFIRAKRGRCPRCGYDLRGQLAQGCPECGWNRPADDAAIK